MHRAVEVSDRALRRRRATAARSREAPACRARVRGRASSSTTDTPGRVALVATELATQPRQARRRRRARRRRATRRPRRGSSCSRSTGARAWPTSADASTTATRPREPGHRARAPSARLSDALRRVLAARRGHRRARACCRRPGRRAPCDGLELGAVSRADGGRDGVRRRLGRDATPTVLRRAGRRRPGSRPGAAEAARRRVRAFRRARGRARRRHVVGARTPRPAAHRGAAVAVARSTGRRSRALLPESATSRRLMRRRRRARHLVSHNGTLGHEARRSQEFTYPWPTGRRCCHALRRPRHALGPRPLSRAARSAIPASSPACSTATSRRGRDDVTVVGGPRARRRDEPAHCSTVDVAPRAATSWPRASGRARSRRSLGFDGQDQTRIATAVSEIARNAFRYAGGGRVEFAIEGERAPQLLRASSSATRGPASPNLRRVLAGRYRSATGMGLGIVGARRLMDHFDDRDRRRAARRSSLREAAAARRAAGHADRGVASSASELAAGARADVRWRRCSSRTSELLRTLERAARAAGGARRGSTASSRTPTAASSRSTPSSTRRPTTCAAPTR